MAKHSIIARSLLLLLRVMWSGGLHTNYSWWWDNDGPKQSSSCRDPVDMDWWLWKGINVANHLPSTFLSCRASWLQKQQQRLRAKKEQQSPHEDFYGRTTYERNYATTTRPGKLNASKRFDGYTSDTTFGDEIDYRRPYAQTPPPPRNHVYGNGDAGRNYNTISTVTTTTKTVNNNERPFVAVRRAHEQSKQGYNVSDSWHLTGFNLIQVDFR